jgi:hypothetical protein
MKIRKKTLKSWLYKLIVIAIVVAMLLSVFVVMLSN